MSRQLKKITTIMLALIVTMFMCVPMFSAYAANSAPSESDTQTATVNNVESGAQVLAYKIVKANYNTSGFTGYSDVAAGTIKDPQAPTSDEITSLASDTSSLGTPVTMTETSTGTYTAKLAAGYWMVLVKGTGDTIYNPMLVGVYYSVSGSDNTLASGPVSANDSWDLVTKGAYAKSTNPGIHKTIVDPSSGNSKGDDGYIGSKVSYQIETTIPSYSSEYKTATFEINDSLSKGLTYAGDIKVLYDDAGNYVAVPSDDYTVETTDNSLKVAFTSAYILKHGLQNIKVTYTATLNSDAGQNFDPNTNTATLTYTHDPSNATSSKKDKTYNYTFAIDANLNGASSFQTSELIKTNEDGTVVTKDDGTTTVTGALAGATFTLTNTATDSKEPVHTATSDASGYLNFNGLDAGTYTLVETQAPNGYALDATKHTVVISANYNGDGTLQSYSIAIDGTATSTYTATYANGKITNIDKTVQPTTIKNGKVGTLPSTGGIGTFIFIIVGTMLIAIAIRMLYVNKKRSQATETEE
jgi:fimbrial isopeptide formation D2 family protein/LPXTG-motif cell wall-anchored protein